MSQRIRLFSLFSMLAWWALANPRDALKLLDDINEIHHRRRVRDYVDAILRLTKRDTTPPEGGQE